MSELAAWVVAALVILITALGIWGISMSVARSRAEAERKCREREWIDAMTQWRDAMTDYRDRDST